MDVERLAVFAGVGVALAVGAFVLWGPAPRPRKRGRVNGISNLGYTCFLNSLLQALAACTTFTIWLKEQGKKKKSSSFISNLIAVIDRINGYSEDLYDDVAPIEVITSLGSLWNFDPGHQDAHELFHVILSALQNEIQTPNRKGCLSDALPINRGPEIAPDVKGSGDSLALRSVSCNDIAQAEVSTTINNLDKNSNHPLNSSTKSISHFSICNKPGIILARSSEILCRALAEPIDEQSPSRTWSSLCTIPQQSSCVLSNETHPFSGLLTSQLKCTNCNWKSAVRYDKLETISLPLPPAGEALTWRRHTLAELFSRFVTSEVIQNVECNGCSTRCSAMKTLTLGKLPRCLCLHIPRTTWSNSGIPIKRDDPVIFPEYFVLDPFTFTEFKKRNAQTTLPMMLIANQTPNQGKHRYKLQAVVEHRGPVDAGHFVCYRRGNRAGQWLYTSDTIVENTELTDVLCASPYLLFYEKITG
ncbi:ubiquitin carboxyl-terminal hydrolase 30 homolog [Chelonus insularis]|uniref:ubiquitin carboxyl-terminal hydrolase 30 homolog n=1 Tax=Chelonus insularis TaxID=460826 RepID=UPI00158D205C|nr:ubiquitin carboxyl-terminal hydrolase 30 homolog [Chelonus insularis]